MTTTLLDQAYAEMLLAPDQDAPRLAYFARLAEAELFLMLARDPEGDSIEPELFALSDGAFALVFDREDRLAGFAGRPVPYAALSGRSVAAMFAGQGVGLAVNLGVDGGENILPPQAVNWLAETVAARASEAEDRPEAFFAPHGLPEPLLGALDAKLAQAAGLARRAYLAECSYESGVRTHLLAFTGTLPGAEDALVQAVNEALVFSGLEAGSLDVTFLRDTDPAAAAIARAGLRFDLPEPQADTHAPKAPGRDPEKPPILR